jgi:Ca2+-binding RTX toxin-like protein
MAKTFEFTQLTALNTLSILNPNSELLVYTPLGLNVTARKFDSDGNATAEVADTNELLIGYNTTAVPPLSLGIVDIDILVKNGDSTNDSLRATPGNDIVYWDYATLFSLATLSVPVGVAVVSRYNLPSADQNAAIEIFDLGGGNDILNLTSSNQQFLVSGLLTDPMAYAYAATAYGGDGNDIIWSANQNDALFGDAGADRMDGGGGNDTLYGGTGLDSLAGEAGDDVLMDFADGAVFAGGGGNDQMYLQVSNANLTLGPSSADNGDVSDGDDKVVIGGDYASTSFTMGGGDDILIALESTAASADSVSGGTGNDVVSTWSGEDKVFGDEGGDALWGGAGADTIYGGADDDILYDGPDADQVFGGTGQDMVYFSRESSAGNEYYDLARLGEPADGTVNAIVAFGAWDPLETEGDGLDDKQSVYETDGNIMDNEGGDDMVYVHQVSGNIYRLEYVGGGTTGASIDFDVRDIDTIVLWDNAGASGQYQQHYQWDGVDSYTRVL